MERFKIHIDNGDGSTVYDILEPSHDDTGVLAAIEALRTYARHGHSRFPYNRQKLVITVEVNDEDGA